jgi:hypothetical protein
MTFPQSANQRPGSARAEVNNFYVIAPQTAQAQGTAPFLHDHTVGVAPSQNRGPSVFWHGYFVVCSATGISTGRCVQFTAIQRSVEGTRFDAEMALLKRLFVLEVGHGLRPPPTRSMRRR